MQSEWDAVREGEMAGVEGEWLKFKKAVMRRTEEVCGMRKVGSGIRKGSEWWNENTRRIVREKKMAFETWLQNRSRDAHERYKEKRKEAKRAVDLAKRRADEEWGQKLTHDFSERKKVFWKEVKRLRKGDANEEVKVKDANGRLLLEGSEVRARWAEYFEELLNVEDDREARIVAVGRMNVPVFSEMNEKRVERVEVMEALKELKEGKAPGMDGCAAECLRRGGVAIIEWLVRILNVCFDESLVPEDWCSACIVPLYKGKGDRYECSNSRGISLLSVVGKVYGRVLIKRVREKTEEVLKEEQCGFRRGRGCVDQIFAVRQISEKYLAKGKEVFWAFMDLEKAYDRVDREALWQVVGLYEVGGKLLRALKSFYVGSKACVRVGNEVSDSFLVKTGVRQGCVMSPWLFNLYMDGVVREVNERVLGRGAKLKGRNGLTWEVNQLLFADDTALVADSEKKLRRLVNEFGRVCERRKLKVNVAKSKVMRCARDGVVGTLQVCLNGEVLEEVESFKYLGSNVAASGGVEDEVKHRVNEGCKALGALKKVMNGRSVSMGVKRSLYQSVVMPTVLYGAETWGTRVAERRKVDVFEMKCLRSMVGVSRMDRVRNEEVRARSDIRKKLSERADVNAINWFGHMERMDEQRLVKRIYVSHAEGVRARGRPRMEWLDGVKRCLDGRGLTLDEARVRALDRDEWRAIVRR